MNRTAFFLLLFSVFTSFAQTVSGYVFDNVTKEPLLGASVYFDGTTIGTITNEEGRFTLELEKKITSPLIVSYVGYNDVFLESVWDQKDIKVGMKPKAVSLKEVVLRADPFSRAQKLKAFKEQFLGNTRAGRGCEILNEDAIHLAYDVSKKQLIASADEAIIIKNSYLGYELRFRLSDCAVTYFSRSLDPQEVHQTFYLGTSFFIDKQEGVAKYEKRREKVYLGSSLHLMRTAARQEWETEKFVLFKGSFSIRPENYFRVSDSLGMKKVSLPLKLNVLYKKSRQSAIFPKYKYYFIDDYGNFYPPDAVSFSGDMGAKRTGDLLPLDYGLK
ncbi:hypothetical protein GWK08_04160 [Leptobacterium flavescens]|uniref:Carboxypeptidase-like regulatory domain-containing protein n=1 Tax=Leptobacterium flavescens TaxID=472055 RepID=A0A6P0UJ98_9FLAO|nr:carboxypeptidase-like regulatory domain-containing protein [Leptobacterium flavescens]NER12622.1 hypothetical protein [Leptobacterium flavescens]